MYDDEVHYGPIGSLYDLAGRPYVRPRLAGLKSVSKAARQALGWHPPAPPPPPIGFETKSRR